MTINNDGTAKPITPLMYDPLQSVFEDTMVREGKELTTYSTNKSFNAFFRRNNDNNDVIDRITIYYKSTAPVRQGSLIRYGRNIYLALTQETEENECYLKSSCVKCNGIVTTNTGTVSDVPIYAYEMRGSIVSENLNLSVIDGKMEMITEDFERSRKLKINDRINVFGRTFEIQNIYYKDGMTHLRCDIVADEKPIENLRIDVSGLDALAYKVGDTLTLKATLYANNKVSVGTIVWESTDLEIATIGKDDGKVVFLKDGSVTFKCRWVEKDYVHATDTITVAPVPTDTFTAKISGKTELKVGFERRYTATLHKATGEEVPGTWEFIHDFVPENKLKMTVSGNVATLSIEDEKYIGNQFTLTARETTHDVSATMTITVASIF